METTTPRPRLTLAKQPTTPRPPYLGVWIAHAIPGAGFEPWRPLATWAVEAEGAHNLARLWRRDFPGALVAVRPLDRGMPLLPEGMPDHYDLPPYGEA